MKDIEIARNAKLDNISEIAKKINLDDDDIELYGKYKAKILNKKNKTNGKLILVTAINPTPLGEGKTTVAIGLADGIKLLNKKSILALREPSMGPVFGIKGGATGGGYSQIAPMEDINLHFTGDFHAITTANNLLASCIDNHIYNGNELEFEKVIWKRCLDLNDRALRKIEINLSKEKNMLPRVDSFDITSASEIMAIFCLATDIDDLKFKLENIIVGYNKENRPIYAKQLNVVGAMMVILKTAFYPNLVQTLEHTPAIVHGGPFANIAHGCNSVVATKLAMNLGDYVITEAGFGSDLGAEKFFDIKCRQEKLEPACTVCVATIRALKYHGGQKIDDIENENLECLKIGLENLYKHVDNLKNKFNQNVVVAINKFPTDTNNEIEFLKNELNKKDILVELTNVWAEGGKGAIELAEKVIELCENKLNLKFIYQIDEDIKTKIFKISKEIYGANKVLFSEKAEKEIEKLELNKLDKLPICIAKTQYSLSDNPKKLKIEEEFEIMISDIEIKNGAGFIVAKAGKIFSMPGLPKNPAAEVIDLDEKNNIIGLY
ncbi:MAG: formate--tetrahydrofolate ligase [Clostridia bacterium]|nr:formate--tetrahydrofolate ligase [Clostridia bacterium]